MIVRAYALAAILIYHEKCRSAIKPRGIIFLADIFSDRYFGFLPPILRFDFSKKISANILIRSLNIINCRRTDYRGQASRKRPFHHCIRACLKNRKRRLFAPKRSSSTSKILDKRQFALRFFP